jgi:hypothetical protein
MQDQTSLTNFTLHTPWVSNLQPTRLFYVACDHIYDLCVYYKTFTVI